MAKLPEFKRVSREDLKDAPDWVEGLIGPLNSFMDSVTRGLNKNITFQENIRGAIKDLEFTTSSTYNTGTFTPVTFTYGGGALRPQGVVILQLRQENGAIIKTAISLSWSESNGSISIDYVAGLANSTRYFLRVLVV